MNKWRRKITQQSVALTRNDYNKENNAVYCLHCSCLWGKESKNNDSVSAVGILVQPFTLNLSAYPFCQSFTLSEGNIGNRGSLHQLIEIDHAPRAFLPNCVVKLRMHSRPLDRLCNTIEWIWCLAMSSSHSLCLHHYSYCLLSEVVTMTPCLLSFPS